MARIVVIEDDMIYQMVLKRKLEVLYPSETIEFSLSGQEGISAVTDETVIVISDYMLGDMSGIEAVTQIKTNYPDIEIILLTNVSFKEIESESALVGAFDIINKTNAASSVNEGFYPLKRSIDILLKIDKLKKQLITRMDAKPNQK
jgi:CheY-like chemotaxis protein